MPDDYRELIAELTERQRTLLSLRSGIKPEHLATPREWEEARLVQALDWIVARDYR